MQRMQVISPWIFEGFTVNKKVPCPENHTLNIVGGAQMKFYPPPRKFTQKPLKKGTISKGHVIWTDHWCSGNTVVFGEITKTIRVFEHLRRCVLGGKNMSISLKRSSARCPKDRPHFVHISLHERGLTYLKTLVLFPDESQKLRTILH